MKKNTSDLNAMDNSQFYKDLNENPSILWLSNNGQWLAYALIGLFIILFLVYRFTINTSVDQQNIYWKTETNYQTLANPEKTIGQKKEALQQLHSELEIDPSLQPKFDGLIAQNLFQNSLAQDAIPYAERAIKRTQTENSPYFSSYAQNSILITKNQYEEALKNAIQLKTDLQGKKLDILYLLNLVRIASLQQHLKLPEEKQSWNEIIQLEKNHSVNLLDSIKEGSVTLRKYLETRITQ